jgi:hypothetical protein
MKARCLSKRDNAYENYGGRGIQVCEDWLGFQAFYQWAMDSGYEDQLTLDRMDNDSGYCPENCRFVGWSKQQRNRRDNRYVEYCGERMVVAEFIERYISKGSRSTVYRRLDQGWSPSKIVSFMEGDE